MDSEISSSRIDRDAAIDMAVFSGNLLFHEQDEAHGWALMLIVSNLFELVGEGATSSDRFADGFTKIARLASQEITILGWDTISIARAIRNWIDHGLRLDRRQEMNVATKARATVTTVDLIPLLEGANSDDLYRVYCIEPNTYELHFSPTKFWSYVQDWYGSRT